MEGLWHGCSEETASVARDGEHRIGR